MLSGSVAMSTYVLPRFTRDFDFIVHLKPSDALVLSNHFRVGYYCDEESIRDAISGEGMFNIIDHKSFYKADFVVLKDDTYERIKFGRRRLVDLLEMKIWVVSPEDLLLSKLIWIQPVQSTQQTEDIKLLAEIEGLDWNYIHGWIKELKLNTFDIISA